VDLFVRILSYINLAGAVHALIQAMMLFFTRRGPRRANRIMALFLLAVAIGMANGMASLLGLYDIWPALAVLMGSVALAYHPLFYLYMRAMTGKDRGGRASQLLHGVPFLLGILVWTAYLGTPEGGPFPSGLVGYAVRSPWFFILILAGFQSVAYITAIVRLLRQYTERIKASFSTIDQVRLGWLRRRLLIFLAIWVLGLVLIAAVRFESRANNVVGQIIAFLCALNTFAIGYRAMLRPETFFGFDEAGPGRRYERSSLTPENAELYKARLLEMMEREKLFLDPEITLPKLARSLDIPAAHLSQVVNDLLGRNFYEFVNRYRVEDAKRRLAGPETGREKLITVALDCGFNSVPTFNRVFKEMTGRTPSDYRKNPTSA